MTYDTAVLEPNPDARKPILEVLQAALAAVDPGAAVAHVLRREGDVLYVGERSYDLNRYRRVFVLGAGKAGAPMTQAVEAALGERIRDGLVVTKTGHSRPTQRVRIVEASHPVPDQAGVQAGRDILALAEQADAHDLVIVLLSGGGSALLVAPGPPPGLSPPPGLPQIGGGVSPPRPVGACSQGGGGESPPRPAGAHPQGGGGAEISLEAMQAMNRALLACGATIGEINTLRKHVSAVKGGQLARAVAPATLVTLVLSDVIGNPLDVIASGPTVPDTGAWQDAWAVVEKYALEKRLPATIVERLQAGLRGEIPDTPKPGDPIFARAQALVVADNRRAAQAATAKARELGYHALLLSTFVEGEAAEVAKVLAALGREVRESGHPVPAPACLVLGGETTVTLGAHPGQGGRNQELALSAALALEGAAGVTVVALATDGTDGPTDSAGGMADGGTVARGAAAGLSAADHLRRHDAYPFLAATHDLLMTGPTQTNVNDLLFVFVE